MYTVHRSVHILWWVAVAISTDEPGMPRAVPCSAITQHILLRRHITEDWSAPAWRDIVPGPVVLQLTDCHTSAAQEGRPVLGACRTLFGRGYIATLDLTANGSARPAVRRA